uniref:Alanine dehydrogenase/pyridine nucleotide transhydrogenase NAD(H)-binding domain-containing protein n=1 Tax=Ditylenchus dipsaci TaxID=166011 RepID=A0A915CUE6_9BILA
MVVGALGKCGGGACDLAEKVGIADKNIVKWDRQETQQAGNGPYECILGVDIFINCVYLNPQDTSSPRFLTPQLLDSGAGVLSVICDVSCDVGSAKHPLPVYNSNTTFDKPTVKVQTSDGGCVHVVSIDHLPSLLPKESSQRFSADLLPTLLELKQREKARVWTDAEQIFRQKLNELP